MVLINIFPTNTTCTSNKYRILSEYWLIFEFVCMLYLLFLTEHYVTLYIRCQIYNKVHMISFSPQNHRPQNLRLNCRKTKYKNMEQLPRRKSSNYCKLCDVRIFFTFSYVKTGVDRNIVCLWYRDLIINSFVKK